jgi:hypothetical protein
MDWTNRPVTAVPLHLLVWPCHDIDPGHVHPQPGTVTSTGPIHVEQLIDGHYFIHDGRHRAIRAGLNGEATIPARVLRH